MPRYEWTGDGDFRNGREDEWISPGEEVDLPERVGNPQPELVEVVESDVVDVDEESDDEGEESEADVPELDQYPTNEDGEPLCVGKEDGQCNRVVETPGGSCWQH